MDVHPNEFDRQCDGQFDRRYDRQFDRQFDQMNQMPCCDLLKSKNLNVQCSHNYTIRYVIACLLYKLGRC